MLINKSTNKVVMQNVRIAHSFFAKLRGLMFERKANFNYALIMPLDRETRIRASIHMLFVFFPIAVLFIDENKRVVDKALLKPFTLNYTPKAKCKYIIELPAEKFDEFAINDRAEW
jgi:hypothetical protein